MDTQVIEVRKAIPIIKAIVGETSWTQNIYIDFIPDELIVKSYLYLSDGKEDGVSFIFSDLVNDVLCPVAETIPCYLSTPFLLKRPINGTFTFKVLDSLGALTNGRQGDIYICLEFVKYKAIKEQKVY